jgi:hypothetical protein
MNVPTRGALWLALVAVVLGACASTQPGAASQPAPTRGPVAPSSTIAAWPSRTPFPLAAGAVDVPLATEPPSTLPAGTTWACAADELLPTRVVWAPSTPLAAPRFITVDGALVMSLVWPRGFRAQAIDGRLEIVAPSGAVVARDGDIIGGPSRSVSPCSVDDALYGPAS